MKNDDLSALAAPPECTFDTADTFCLHVGVGAGRCSTNKRSHCVGPIKKSNRRLTTFNGGLSDLDVYEATIRWKLEDDEGRTHTFIIPEGLYVPKSAYCNLSPHHFAQVMNDPVEGGTGCTINGSFVRLFWNNRQFYQQIPLDRSNVAYLIGKE